VIGLVAFLVGLILSGGNVPVPIAWLIGIGAGLLLGMVNGAVITIFRIPAIVVTLGTLSIFRGLVFILAGGKQINLVDLPPGYADLATDAVLGIPVFVIVAAVIVAIAALMHHRRPRMATKPAVAESSLHCTPQPERVCCPIPG